MKNRLNILEVSNLTKIYKLKSDKFGGNYSLPLKYSSNKQITAIDDISFQLRHGECLGVIGKNGAGKSTLLKVLSGIVSPSSGMVQYQGRLLSILDIGTGFHPDLTGRQNIFMNGQILGISKKEISNLLSETESIYPNTKYIAKLDNHEKSKKGDMESPTLKVPYLTKGTCENGTFSGPILGCSKLIDTFMKRLFNYEHFEEICSTLVGKNFKIWRFF